jgi:hypothetical protein
MMSGGVCDSGDFDMAVEQILPFLCAGLSAPAPAEPVPPIPTKP